MNTEQSAGGLIVHESTRGWEVLIIKDMKGQWTFPKGLIEQGEDPLTAAKREIAEEVNVFDLTFMAKCAPILYWYVREGEKIKKTVQYFLFSTKSREPIIPQREEGITEVKWVLLTDADAMIGYPETNKPLLVQAREVLDGV